MQARLTIRNVLARGAAFGWKRRRVEAAAAAGGGVASRPEHNF
jgi:hypothetical protein